MQRKISFSHYSIRHKLGHFWQNTQGVYAVMTSLLSFVLIGYIAFVVDGTGLVLDKVRLTQGLEQAGFLLTAEDNNYRDEKNIYEVNSQSNLLTPTEIEAAKVKGSLSDIEAKNLITSVNQFYQHSIKNDEDFKDNTFYKRYARNMQMIKGIVRSYYLPNSYTAYKEGGNGENNFNINDHFSYLCGEIKNTRNIGCLVDGNFNRPSWLYWGKQYKKEYGTTFDRTEKVAANTVFITKQKHDNPPIDMMLITDMSGSMTEDFPENPSEKKITALRNAFATIADEMLKKQYDDNGNLIKNYNRIGFTSFAYGAQQYNFTNPKSTENSCLLPYKLKPKALVNEVYKTEIDTNYKDRKLESIVNSFCWKPKCKNTLRAQLSGKFICERNNQKFTQPNPRLEGETSICHCPQNGCGWESDGTRRGDLINVKKVVKTTFGDSYLESFEYEFNNLWYYNHVNSAVEGEEHLQLRHKLSRGLSEKIDYNGSRLYPIDIEGTINLIDKFKANQSYPDSRNMIKINKGTMCLKNNPSTMTTNLWFDQDSKDNLKQIFKNIEPQGATLSSSGVLIGSQLMMNKNIIGNVQPAKLKINTKRYIVILSDGIDGGENIFYDTPEITLNLINAGMCERIRKKIDSLQDKNYSTFPTKISFITLGTSDYQIKQQGEKNTQKFEKAWKKCVGKENYFSVSSQKELLEALRIASGLTEEVGTASDSKPIFKN